MDQISVGENMIRRRSAVPGGGGPASGMMCACGRPRMRAKTRQISYFVKGSSAELCIFGGSRALLGLSGSQVKENGGESGCAS